MSKLFLKEVEYIDGVTEFLLSNNQTQLLSQNSNTFILNETPEENTIVFSGDTTLFKRQVYKESDLDLIGSYFIDYSQPEPVLKINSATKTSTLTYTYISYISKTKVKANSLYSVDYIKGIVYTSNNIKNVKISYKHSTSYYEGVEMTQASPQEYSLTSNLIPNDDEKIVYVYQIEDESISNQTVEILENPILNLITLEDNDEY